MGATAATLLCSGMANDALQAAPRQATNAPGVRWIKLSSGHKVWTQRMGSGPVKVLLLHGGPGFSHDYLQCFADFLPQAGYELYFYDQLGCGNSDRPNDPSLWTLPRYLQEVEEVRAGLGLDRFVLYGHSWGGILGIEYALTHPDRLSGFILSNMTASIDDYIAYTTRLRAALPEATRKELDRLEAASEAGGKEFNEIIERELYPRHILRLETWPEPVMKAFAAVNGDIYNQMQGANEFVFTGNLRKWDRWADLPKIRTRTLIMGAANDEMDPQSVRREASLISDAELFISQQGSHLAMWDDQKAYFEALLRFLPSVKVT
ncbi:proline iminopeptidase-family hydrolase [Novosphingobium sp. AP12]|uniref:proline iminopeptidase-family hydrolase n=1 Tax=Novosphingobium sp. AP12 TaxID=1144305 RepID=UPI001930E1DA|nr:proline iminopeptidase-family hydrolase [Novosphingobium sp. AP12]